MADTHTVLAEPLHVAIRKMDAMRKPCAITEPAHILEIIDRAHAEHCLAEFILVLGFGQVRVQAAIVLLGQRSTRTHEGLRDAER